MLQSKEFAMWLYRFVALLVQAAIIVSPLDIYHRDSHGPVNFILTYLSTFLDLVSYQIFFVHSEVVGPSWYANPNLLPPFRIVRIISPWAISLTSALNRGAYNTY